MHEDEIEDNEWSEDDDNYSGDPLVDQSLLAFLERFMYKKPKPPKQEKVDGEDKGRKEASAYSTHARRRDNLAKAAEMRSYSNKPLANVNSANFAKLGGEMAAGPSGGTLRKIQGPRDESSTSSSAARPNRPNAPPGWLPLPQRCRLPSVALQPLSSSRRAPPPPW